MDALGQLTGGVAHDFNNLLMIVSGHIETLKRLAKDNPKAARAAEAIEIATKRGAALTRQLLTFSRRQRLSPAAIDLAQQLEAFRPVLTSGLGPNVRLDTIVPADLWPVRVDVGEFEIALVNLMVNARDAMPDGGTVTITATNFVAAPGGPLTGEFVALTVTDTGVGIPEDVLSRIFDPFFTTKPVGRGTGLGLSQVHGFAHQSGGAVNVESVVGEGTRMTLYLPRATQVEVEREADSPSEHLSTGTVLVVEDNPEVASAAAGLLEQLGYSVRTVSGGEDALLALDANGIDLVFTDVVMPGRLDGLALAREIRRKYPDMPVLLATGYAATVQNVNGEFPVLRKPYQIGELSQALARLPARTHARSNLVPFSPKRGRRPRNGEPETS
jgi:CheY-like chemotaxis protein